ncbi:MAG: tetratricopeptide repeat protein [Aquificae bacterium]|nr:tetratricopeptide repeat protein [Aquificota bacterium]
MDRKEKKKLPLEKDVDIEFEYKVYMLYDRLKKYKYPILAGAVAFFIALGGYFYYKNHKEQLLNASSVVLYQIQKAYAAKNYQQVATLVEKLKKEYPSSPYLKVGEAYLLLAKKEEGKPDGKIADSIQEKLKTKQLKGNLTEFKAYLHYSNGDYKQTLSLLERIDSTFYNYVSALTLKGFTYKKLGEKDKAVAVFKQVEELSKYDYFKLIAKENM